MNDAQRYDVVVAGGGHAGAEAAWAAANLGARVALVTFDPQAIGRLSCNPAIGGIGKGQIVREIDALDGLMGRVADEAGIQFRMLNRGKGPAVQSPRAQVDCELYPRVLQRRLAEHPRIDILPAAVDEIRTRRVDGRTQVVGVALADGVTLDARAVVVTAGTFLRGLMHTGERQTEGGRIGEPAATKLSASLKSLGLQLGRLKTGTPPRLHRDTIDYDRLRPQPGDDEPTPFSFMTDAIRCEQAQCWIAFTNPAVHDVIRANLHRAPMYSGQIESTGPRYCPSIETKIVRFADKDRHQVFLEPESRNGERIYVNGVSTSLPEDVQTFMIAHIEGLENARVLQWGYAIEYDFVPPEQIDATLMTKHVRGLFLAGQVCGTSGYEEAAGQGLVAGANAALLVADRPAFTLGRDEAYIGVMIDDLVTRGVTEPYRMFTSRAEHRMHLRYDNADTRLTPKGREIGLVNEERWRRFESTQNAVCDLLALCAELRCEGRSLRDWLRRPDEDGERFVAAFDALRPYRQNVDVWRRALVELKYSGYLKRQERLIEQFRTLEDHPIPPDFDYHAVSHLRHEAKERLSAVRPISLGQASRVSGVHPSDISVLMISLARTRSGSAHRTDR